jgi:hypothetical protein
LLVVSLGCLAAATLVSTAVAHETVETRGYAFALGWGIEPAYVGQLNSVQLIVTHEDDGEPVNDAGARLTVTVSYGDQSTKLSLDPAFGSEVGAGTPGEYRALLIPTAPGDYTFHVKGTVGGVEVNKKVKSSPKTFSPVVEVAAAQFPVQVPGNEQIAQRLEAELRRLATRDDVASEVASARTLGYIGIAVGALGVIIAAAALVVARRA